MWLISHPSRAADGPAVWVEKDVHGMRQNFPDQAMLKMPEVMDTNASNGKAFSQMRVDGFDTFAQSVSCK
jgi:hypothetical protein